MTVLTKNLSFIIIGTILITCSPTKSTSTIYSDEYDKAKDLTSILIFPYGQISIPGKWTKTSYNNASRQYFFSNADSVTFAVALNPWDKYEFFKQGMTGAEFVKAYYEWDANYWKQQTKGQLKTIKENEEKNYLIWNLLRDPDVDSYFLFGLKNKTSFNLYVSSDKWDERKKVELLEKIYNE